MPERRFRKGELVAFQWGTRTVHGTVTEDRGPIGIKGRRLYEVEFRLGPHGESLSHTELPAADLQLLQEPVTTN